MKVFLLNEINKYDSVGINLLSAVLKERGHQARVFLVPDLITNTTISLKWLKIAKFMFHISDEDYIDFLLSLKPDMIGFSVVTSYWTRASRLAKIVKRKNVGVITVAGGPHTTVSLDAGMFEEGGFDYICKGDGEIALPELADAIGRGNLDPQISGIYYKRNGKMVGEGLGEVVYDLDRLPFQDKSDVYEDYPYLRKLYCINTQRSCQYSCTYCGSPNYRKQYASAGERIFRRRSVGSVIKELSDAKMKYPTLEKVGFFDDTFTTGDEWIREFAGEYKKHVGLPYFMCTNPCLLQDESLVASLKESGLTYVEIGVQAIDEKFRMREIKRPDTDAHIFASGRLLRKYNIYFQANHIFGLDERDYHDEDFLRKTVEYYLELKANRVHCFELEYLPGSAEMEKALQSKKISREDYQNILKGNSSVSYNFGGSIDGKRKKKFVAYLVLLEMTPFLPAAWIRHILYSKVLFRVLKLIPHDYIILARILNTLKDRRDLEGVPHYGKYISGARYILRIKRALRRNRKDA